MIRFLTLWFIIGATAFAVETGPVKVLRVIDGNTIEVQANLGGQLCPVRVRLLYVDTPVPADDEHGETRGEGAAAMGLLATFIEESQETTLWAPGAELEVDRYNRVLAVVNCVHPTPDEETLNPSAQAMLIIEGYSSVWEKDGPVPEPLREEFQKLEHTARLYKNGAWSTAPKWMENKSNERTAPKTEK